MKIKVTELEDLREAASRLLDFAADERVFLFKGEMGAGKTTFIKALCERLQITDVVSSPTFSIVNEYHTDHGPVYHFDFYRLKKESEAFDLGYEDYFLFRVVLFYRMAGKNPEPMARTLYLS